jgi:hypothetical protein
MKQKRSSLHLVGLSTTQQMGQALRKGPPEEAGEAETRS